MPVAEERNMTGRKLEQGRPPDLFENTHSLGEWMGRYKRNRTHLATLSSKIENIKKDIAKQKKLTDKQEAEYNSLADEVYVQLAERQAAVKAALAEGNCTGHFWIVFISG